MLDAFRAVASNVADTKGEDTMAKETKQQAKEQKVRAKIIKKARKKIIYKVHVNHRSVSMEALTEGQPEYTAASNSAIKRLRDAIKARDTLKKKPELPDETFYFSVLGTAREFAEMVIKDIENRLVSEYDAIEGFKD